jgi:Tol biopolymer transport system component
MGVSPLVIAGIALGFGALAVLVTVLLLKPDPPPPAPFEEMSIRRISSTSKSVAMALSPDSKYLVHAVDEGKGQSLWVRQISTGSDIPLVPVGPVHYVDCIVSPGGDYVYYVSADNATDIGSVHRVPLLGGGVTQTIVHDLHGRIAISRDGKWIAYSVQDREAGETRLMIAGSEGTGSRIVSARPLPDAWGAVTWSPDGERLVAALRAYSEGFGTRLVELPIEGGEHREIGKAWRTIESLAWVGDGTTLVVNGKDLPTSTRNQLWLVDAAASSRRRITNDLNDYEALSPALDGSSLVTLQKSQTSALWLVPDGNTSLAAPLVATSENIDGANGLTWTADGNIVYASEGSDERDLWRISPDGGSRERLTTGRSDVLPSASPDGRYIVFVSTRAGQPNLWRVNADGSAPTPLTHGSHETSPDIAPDSQWVYYHDYREGVRTIRRVAIDGGEPVRVTTEPSSWPSVSPDGTRFACSWWDASHTRARIAIIPADGSTPEHLLDIPVNYWMGANNHHTRWTPDGSSLVYVDKHDGVANLWSRPVDGAPAVQVTHFREGSEIFWFDLSKDGKHIACARGNITSHVVAISNFQ